MLHDIRRKDIYQILKLAALAALPIYVLCLDARELATEHSLCLFKNIFHRECYGCGMMKALVALAHGEIGLAAQFNRLVFVAMPIIIYCWAREMWRTYHYFFGKKPPEKGK